MGLNGVKAVQWVFEASFKGVSRACIYAPFFMKILLVVNYYLITYLFAPKKWSTYSFYLTISTRSLRLKKNNKKTA